MIIVAVFSERWSSAVFYKKKQREEDKRMKKKVLAFLLASTMVIEPFTVASAADFSDGMGQDTVQFSDDAEDVPEVENDDVDQFDTDVAGADDSTLLTFEEVRSGWISYDELNVKGVINKDALYYVTYVPFCSDAGNAAYTLRLTLFSTFLLPFSVLFCCTLSHYLLLSHT